MADEGTQDVFQKFEPVIQEALDAFSAQAGGAVEFGPEAVRLSQIEGADRPTSWPAEVRYRDEAVGSLTTMVFRYYDGTGSEIGERKPDGQGGSFLETAKAIPRPGVAEQAVHGDVHLALAAFRGEAGERRFDPKLLAGSLSLFGTLAGGRALAHIGYLGQNAPDFAEAMSGRQAPRPAATATIQPRRLNPFSGPNHPYRSAAPRAVYNRYPGISQVAAFLTLNREDDRISIAQADMLRRLETAEPVLGQTRRLLWPLQGR